MLKDVLMAIKEINGYSQKDISQLSGLSYVYIQSLLEGKRVNPSQKTLEKLAIVFNINIHELIKIIDYSNQLEENLNSNNKKDSLLIKALIFKEISTYYIENSEKRIQSNRVKEYKRIK